jgi:serine/threonine-protein kinase
VSARAELREMFQREARAAASLNHPGIVTIYDFGMLEGRAFICMEMVDGSPVDELQDQLTIVESLQIAKQALEALDYAHQRHIIHRDIKPSNLMRTRSGLVKIMDFGIAKPLDESSSLHLAQRGKTIVAGTPAFMPPEQLAGEPMDLRVDIFALGVTLYELLTRELPYNGLDRTTVPATPQELVPAIPDQIDSAIMRAIASQRDDRWASAREFAEALRRVLAAVGRFSSKPPPIRRQ